MSEQPFSFRTAMNSAIVKVEEQSTTITTISIHDRELSTSTPAVAACDHNELRILRDRIDSILAKYRVAPPPPPPVKLHPHDRVLLLAQVAGTVACDNLEGVPAPDVATRAVFIAEEILKRCEL